MIKGLVSRCHFWNCLHLGELYIDHLLLSNIQPWICYVMTKYFYIDQERTRDHVKHVSVAFCENTYTPVLVYAFIKNQTLVYVYQHNWFIWERTFFPLKGKLRASTTNQKHIKAQSYLSILERHISRTIVCSSNLLSYIGILNYFYWKKNLIMNTMSPNPDLIKDEHFYGFLTISNN